MSGKMLSFLMKNYRKEQQCSASKSQLETKKRKKIFHENSVENIFHFYFTFNMQTTYFQLPNLVFMYFVCFLDVAFI